jgi:hypothetical protein
MRCSSAGLFSAQTPVMPNAATMWFAASTSRIWAVYPASEPASNVRVAVMLDVSPRRITCA